MLRNARGRASMALALGMMGMVSAALADGSKARCSISTLKGTYSFAMQGSLAAGSDTFVPEAYIGFTTYDGLGNIWLSKTSSINGVWAVRGSTGTYSLGNDCVGVATYPGSSKFQYYVAPDGSSLNFVKIASYVDGQFVETPDRLSSTAIRVSKKALVAPPP